MGRPVLTAVWPGTHTVPGMANPAPDTQPHRKGEYHNRISRKSCMDTVLRITICAHKYINKAFLNPDCLLTVLSFLEVKPFILVCWSDLSRRSRRQDVKYGNPIRQCRGYNSNGEHQHLQYNWTHISQVNYFATRVEIKLLKWYVSLRFQFTLWGLSL